MGIFSGLFKSRDKPTNSYDSPSYTYFFGRSNAGKRVTDRTALQHIAVYACVRVLSEAIAQLPLHVYKYNDSVDRQTYTLYIHNQSVVLPPNQGKLLETLLAHGGQTATKDELNRALWGTTEFIDENALQVNLTRLKKTMASLGMCQQLVSVRGVGYRLEVAHEA